MKIEPVKFQVQKDFNLKATRYYEVPRSILAETKEEITRLLNEGIIEESTQTYSSPAFVIKKKNGKIRLVIDYRQVNSFLQDDIHIIPKIEEILFGLSGKPILSKIDLSNGFNQQPIDKTSREITTFSLLGRRYRYKRLPFGLKVGPKLFQKVMTEILKDIENVSIYIDDIIISTKTTEEHEKVLKEVLKRLKDNNVKINFEKSFFMTDQMDILGSRVCKGRLHPNLESLNPLKNISNVKTKKDIQKITGTLNWYRKFIPNLITRISKITDKIKDKKISWEDEDNQIIMEIIEELENGKYLVLPDFQKKFILECDASKEGLGGVIYQEHGVISYFSKKFNNTERNYNVV